MRRECRKRFPRHRFQRKPLVSDAGMHDGTCVTHVLWCMSGSLSRAGGKTVPDIPNACSTRNFTYLTRGLPYPEPVYTGWSSVHWNATGMPLVDPVYTGTPLEKLSWNSPTLECHWRILVESVPHWDATGETLTFTAYTGTPLDGLCQPTPAPTHIV